MISCKKVFVLINILLFSFLMAESAYCQIGYGQENDQGLIRIAGIGQLADTLSLWGDVGRTGRYLVPRGTTIDKLISYAGGPGKIRVGGGDNPWAKVRLKVNISYFDKRKRKQVVKSFKFKYSDPIPLAMTNYEVSNDQIISVEVKRKPAFIDYLRVIGPILGTITTSYFIYDQIIK